MKNLDLFPLNRVIACFLIGFLWSCKSEKVPKTTVTEAIDVTVLDPHSYANFGEIQTKHLSLEMEINFKNKTIYGVARHEVINRNARKAIFDINGPLIQKVTTGPKGKEVEVDFVIGKMDKDSILGQPLVVTVTPQTTLINIYYQTTTRSAALEWVNSNANPFLYSQGQAILTRTWIPVQDAPANRITYDAQLHVPKGLLALMSASNPTKINPEGTYKFTMDQPIPSYLIALTVGNLVYHPYNSRCGVYAQPEILESAKQEFSELPVMMQTAEQLFGPYAWGKYDIIVQHPSFPFGGMENPRLSFINPTVIAGDKSLVSVVAHELAHSWSGNLVTNETWNDFWLNEGFTVYFEHRIMEAMHGQEYSRMLSEIEFNELQQELKSISTSKYPKDAALCLDLKNRNPDDGMTSVAYVKGAYFLKTLERAVGRKKMDNFLTLYFKEFRFKTINSSKFISFLNAQLLTPNQIKFDAKPWIYQEGLPKNCVNEVSTRLSNIRKLAEQTNGGKDIFAPERKFKWVIRGGKKKIRRKKYFTERLNPKEISSQEWVMFLRNLSSTLSDQQLAQLDHSAQFSRANSEIEFEWLMLNLRCENWKIATELERFLGRFGRRKYILPLFEAMIKTPNGKTWALRVFEKTKENYHAVTRNSVMARLNENP